jgi:hypothetical protein
MDTAQDHGAAANGCPLRLDLTSPLPCIGSSRQRITASSFMLNRHFPLLDLSQLSDDEIAGEPILRNTLRLLKYSRSKHLASKLGEFLQLIAQSLPEGRLPQWIRGHRSLCHVGQQGY